MARTLQTAGVGHGDRVLTWSQNDPWLVAAYFAVWRLGAVIVPREREWMAEGQEVEVLLYDDEDPTASHEGGLES